MITVGTQIAFKMSIIIHACRMKTWHSVCLFCDHYTQFSILHMSYCIYILLTRAYITFCWCLCCQLLSCIFLYNKNDMYSIFNWMHNRWNKYAKHPLFKIQNVLFIIYLHSMQIETRMLRQKTICARKTISNAKITWRTRHLVGSQMCNTN